jgi:hypothetical protein
MRASVASRDARWKISRFSVGRRLTDRVSLRLTLAVLCAAPAAWASPAAKPAIDVGPDVPFEAAQIEVALRGRLATDAPPAVHIVARAWGVEIQVASLHREVALDGRTGSDAARLVALAMLDLLEQPAAEIVDAPAPLAPSSHARGLEVSAYSGAAQWSGTLASVGAGLVVPVAGHLIGIDASGGKLVTGDFQLTTATLRLSAVARTGPVEARGGVVVAPVFVSDGDGDSTVLLGVGGSVGYRIGIAEPVHLVMRAGADFFATRTEYTRMGVPTASTPWFAPWFALGIEVTP